MNIEIERKFLVCGEYKSKAYSHSHIEQGYFDSAPGRTIRVRIRDDKAYLTIKGPSNQAGLARYEFETEVLVRMAWRGFRLLEVPVDVVYPEDRVTHFRRGADFTRISLMNTFLTGGALVYGYPRMLYHKIFR